MTCCSFGLAYTGGISPNVTIITCTRPSRSDDDCENYRKNAINSYVIDQSCCSDMKSVWRTCATSVRFIDSMKPIEFML